MKNWRESFKPTTKRSNRNHVITFDSHLKTALLVIDDGNNVDSFDNDYDDDNYDKVEDIDDANGNDDDNNNNNANDDVDDTINNKDADVNNDNVNDDSSYNRCACISPLVRDVRFRK